MCTARATAWWLPSTDRDLQPTRPRIRLQANRLPIARGLSSSDSGQHRDTHEAPTPQGGHLASHRMRGALSLWGTVPPPARHRRPHLYTPSPAPRRLGLRHPSTMPHDCLPDAGKSALRCADGWSALHVPMECGALADAVHCISRYIRCRRRRLSVSPRFLK